MVEDLATVQVEDSLSQMWSKLLGTDDFTDTDDFYQSGGNSLKALILMTEMNKSFELSLGFEDLVGNMSVSQLAVLIRERTGMTNAYETSEVQPQAEPSAEQTTEREMDDDFQREDALLHINDFVDGRQTLVLVHDVSGNLSGYANLLEAVRDSYNCIGLRLPTKTRPGPQKLNVFDLASEYSEALEPLVVRAGKTIVLGWSLGGVIGFELVKRLEAKRAASLSLVVLDSPYLNSEGGQSELVSQAAKINLSFEQERVLVLGMCQQIGFSFNDEDCASTEDLWQSLQDQASGFDRQLLNKQLGQQYEMFTRVFPHYSQFDPAALFAHLNNFRSLLACAANHEMSGIVPSKLYYLAASESENYDERWGDHSLQKVEFQVLTGDHFSILRKSQVGGLVDLLKAIFQKLDNCC